MSSAAGAAAEKLRQISEEKFQSNIMGTLAYPEDLNSISPNFYAPYGWGMDWMCDPSECQAIGCIGGGHSTKNNNYVCDPRTGELIERKLFEQMYRHRNDHPLTISEIEKMPMSDQESYIAALNNIGPWVLYDDIFADTGCCGTTGNCNRSNCSACKSGCRGRYFPNVFDIRIQKIKTTHPALSANPTLEYALSVNGVQGNNIILQRNVKYFFYVKTDIAGVDNCNLYNDASDAINWLEIALMFSRQPLSGSGATLMNNTIPMPVGNAVWLNVPINWPGACFMVANNDKIAGVGVITLPNSRN